MYSQHSRVSLLTYIIKTTTCSFYWKNSWLAYQKRMVILYTLLYLSRCIKNCSPCYCCLAYSLYTHRHVICITRIQSHPNELVRNPSFRIRWCEGLGIGDKKWCNRIEVCSAVPLQRRMYNYPYGRIAHIVYGNRRFRFMMAAMVTINN